MAIPFIGGVSGNLGGNGVGRTGDLTAAVVSTPKISHQDYFLSNGFSVLRVPMTIYRTSTPNSNPNCIDNVHLQMVGDFTYRLQGYRLAIVQTSEYELTGGFTPTVVTKSTYRLLEQSQAGQKEIRRGDFPSDDTHPIQLDFSLDDKDFMLRVDFPKARATAYIPAVPVVVTGKRMPEKEQMFDHPFSVYLFPKNQGANATIIKLASTEKGNIASPTFEISGRKYMIAVSGLDRGLPANADLNMTYLKHAASYDLAVFELGRDGTRRIVHGTRKETGDVGHGANAEETQTLTIGDQTFLIQAYAD